MHVLRARAGQLVQAQMSTLAICTCAEELLVNRSAEQIE
jgi:hypothetical protein